MIVRVAVLDGSEQMTAGLGQWLAAAGLGKEAQSYGSMVGVTSIDDCRRAASSIVAWVLGSTRDFKLGINGPGADSVLHDLQDAGLEESIVSMLAAAADIDF
jgi:hypothetical protein